MKRHLGIIITTAIIAGCGATQQDVVNYESENNLSHSEKIQCIGMSKLSNKNNPVDIFLGLSKCVKNNEYENAAQLYFAGMSYGYFDTKRVADKTAHQAISVLRMNTFGEVSQEKLDSFQEALNMVDTAMICKLLRELDKPIYTPTYMIQHGMRAFTGQTTKNGLVNDFDANSAWSETLTTIAKCNVES